MPITARRVETFGTTVFTEINQLAQQYQALNLGQGRPDFDAPQGVILRMVQALQAGSYNQYAPGPGTVSLRQAVANHAARFYGMEIDAARGVIVTAGATEAIFSAVLGLVDPGEEVIIIEPYYDSYQPNVVMAHAQPVYVPLHPPTWSFDLDELRAAFTSKTRALILNTPHNPTGRVFSRAELTMIAELCIEHDVTVISDEVYEHLLFDDVQHIPIATLPGMFERTVTIGSAGKIFNATGWKIGWVYGHPDLMEGVARAHQFITFAVNHPAQEAVAYALNLPTSYFEELKTLYATKRQLMLTGLEHAGLRCNVPQGTYFVMADYSSVFTGTPMEFTRYLIEQIGVACIPPESFYSPEHAHIADGFVRFAFCKTDALLQQASGKLARLPQLATAHKHE